jgi:SAM-dependent methyltransferase
MELSPYLRPRDCPVCGSADASNVVYSARIDEQKLNGFAFASRKLPEYMHLTLLKCPTCRVLYASPGFVPEFLANAYRDASYDSSEEARYAAKTYARQLTSILSGMNDREAALDVGTGNGAFLHYLREAGFHKVIGLEPSLKAVACAEEWMRPLIRVGVFRARDFEPNSLSLVSCFQTIEHVENPRALCIDLYGLLRPRGAIFLVAHNYCSWTSRVLGERSPIFDIEHQQLFSKGSLRYLLTACNFQDVRTGSIWNSYPLTYWLRLLPIPAWLKQRAIQGAKRLHIGKVPLRLNIGNIFAVGFKGAA